MSQSQQDKVWWYAKSGKQLGPFSGTELRSHAQRGEFSVTDLVWKEGLPNWVAAGTIKGLIPAPSKSSPPPVPGQIASGSVRSSAMTLEVSPSWQRRFAMIEKAGGPKLPKVRDLSFTERLSIFGNILAYLFGPIYYLTKGMWKKALGLCLLIFLGLLVLLTIGHFFRIDFTSIANMVGPVVFGTRSNIDYYKKMVLKDDGWF